MSFIFDIALNVARSLGPPRIFQNQGLKMNRYNYSNIPSNRDKVKDENDGEVVNEVV